ncbi:flagellar basal-body rod protein FlgG [Pullulanibacillus pueri]|uniref:Flagellar hook-basal body complex protein FlhP n=1 Tax=Pullulanibacillus pueri TaxID=1437324 RepID=A0A8J3END6_9BACL|nr:flagellar hook-basal body protein [Pullulanibacillus pueri]MBM7681760.1 flagellar basal-body rod protein FlgG [Pullulanibacillus pueri]GGH84161.1 flagellar hook-basal body complex protein FlhP [Pullulanibacillus pueri]
MDRSMITAAVSMGQLQKGMDVISNNISNLNTTGFKGRNVSFSSLLVQSMNEQPDKNQDLGRLSPLGVRFGSGSRVAATQIDPSQGSIEKTDRALDFALGKPNQFFTIQVNDDGGAETRYTRNGAFYLQEDAQNANLMNLVTADGSFVLNNQGNRIQVPAQFKDIKVSNTGAITAQRPGTLDTVNVGQLGVVSIKHPQLLESMGDSAFTLPDLNALGLTRADVFDQLNADDRSVQQGALEASNVDLTDQMTQLTNLQRSYQFDARAISISDDMMNLINSMR